MGTPNRNSGFFFQIFTFEIGSNWIIYKKENGKHDTKVNIELKKIITQVASLFVRRAFHRARLRFFFITTNELHGIQCKSLYGGIVKTILNSINPLVVRHICQSQSQCVNSPLCMDRPDCNCIGFAHNGSKMACFFQFSAENWHFPHFRAWDGSSHRVHEFLKLVWLLWEPHAKITTVRQIYLGS